MLCARVWQRKGSLVNFAGMVAADFLQGESLLDVCEAVELAVDCVPEALSNPRGQIRARIDELPSDREINVICCSGQPAYYATRILLQHGFKAKNISGEMLLQAHNYLTSKDRAHDDVA